MHFHQFFFFFFALVYFLNFFSRPFKNGPEILTSVSLFYDIAAAEVGFKKFSRSSEILFFVIPLIPACLMVFASNIPDY